MKSKRVAYLMLASVMMVFLSVALTSWMPIVLAQQRGPEIDRLRFLTIKSPDAQLIGMQTHQIDFLPDLIRPADIETLAGDGFTITSTPGFHMGFVGYNLHRPVLDDVNFRHALFLAYNQEEIVASIYGYTVTPVQSLIPPAQGGWMATDVPTYPFNPGTHLDAPGTESTFGILKGAGYTYHGTGYGDLSAYWTDPSNNPLPAMTFYTPTYEVAPTSAEHGARITDEWHRVGLNNIDHQPADFGSYTHLVFDLHDFDIFMIFWGLGRFPMQLYGLAHSSEYVPGSDHAVGIQDPILDGYLETLKYGLDHDEKIDAAHDAQRRMYDSSNPWGLAYMLLYSRVYFNSGTPGMDGIVNAPGYGSDNGWTWNNARWVTGHANERIEGSESVIIYCNGEEAPNRSPVSSQTVYEWNTIGLAYDGLIAWNPYDLTDVYWQAENMVVEGPITETITLDSDIDGGDYAGMNAGDSFNLIDGMKITFNLVDGLYWQDGNAVDAGDAEFSLEFLRDNEIPQYITTWQDIVDVQRIDADEFVVYSNVTSQFLYTNWGGAALLLAPQVWSSWDGQPLANILGYDPSTDYTDTGPWSYPDGPDGVPGTGDDPDPTNIGPKTSIMGTGPFIFDFYDPVGQVAEAHAWRAQGSNVGFFKTTAQIADVKADLFYGYGDIDGKGAYGPYTVEDPGWVWANDKYRWGQAFLTYSGDAAYDAYSDINGDGDIDFGDGSIVSSGFGDHLEYGNIP